MNANAIKLVEVFATLLSIGLIVYLWLSNQLPDLYVVSRAGISFLIGACISVIILYYVADRDMDTDIDEIARSIVFAILFGGIPGFAVFICIWFYPGVSLILIGLCIGIALLVLALFGNRNCILLVCGLWAICIAVSIATIFALEVIIFLIALLGSILGIIVIHSKDVQQSKIYQKIKTDGALNPKRRDIFGAKSNCGTASSFRKELFSRLPRIKPNIDKLKAKRDVDGLIKALGNSNEYKSVEKSWIEVEEETIPTKREVMEEKEVILERAIYDPCKRDFIERPLPRMKEWINRYDSGAYWFAVSIQNNMDRAIEEWDVELETSSALKIQDAKIGGIEIEIPHEAHLGLFKISVPKEYGIVIPKGGAQRVYFKLRAEKPKTTYEIKGIFKSEITGDVPIRAKEFKYLCDAGVSPEAVKAELKKAFSEKDVARLALSFKTVQELDRMCNQDTKTDEYMDTLLVLRNYTEGFSNTFTNQLEEFARFMKQEQLGYLDDKYKGKVRRFCTNLVDVWISEFLR